LEEISNPCSIQALQSVVRVGGITAFATLGKRYKDRRLIMITEIENPFDATNLLLHEVRESNLPEYKKAALEKYVRAVMRTIDRMIKNSHILSGIHSMMQTRDSEKYVNGLVKLIREQLAIHNLMVGDYLRDSRETVKEMLEHNIEYDEFQELPRLLKSLGITQHRFADWKELAKTPDDKFEDWFVPFIERATEKDEELTRPDILRYAMTWLRS
jgi:hypothetical protein